MIIGFFVGLLVDIFTNTPGLHAGISVFIMFIREYYFLTVMDEPEDDPNITLYSLGIRGILVYLFPLIFIHLLLLFSIDSGSFSGFGSVIISTFLSSLFSLGCIVILNFAIARKKQRI
jgi:hypothetical protein